MTIPHADLIGRPWSPGGMGPAGPLSCLGVTVGILARAGRMGPSGAREWTALEPVGGAVGEAWPAAAEDALAAWASAADGPWEPLDAAAFLDDPRELDVALLAPESSAATDAPGVGIVVDARRRRLLTSIHGHGVVSLRLYAVGDRVRGAYRWRR